MGRPELQHRRLRRPGRRLRPAAQAQRRARSSTSPASYERVRDVEVSARTPATTASTTAATSTPASRTTSTASSSASIRARKFDFRGLYYYSKAESDPKLGTPHRLRHLRLLAGAGRRGRATRSTRPTSTSTIRSASASPSTSSTSTSAPSTCSILAARRESDVLLTEGHDGALVFPGPDNSAFGVFAGNPTRIGYGGWQGNAQQVATINVDNEFTDFEEPMAETVIGWKGITVAPNWTIGDLDLSGEYSHIDYNTNWQAWGDTSRGITDSIYPELRVRRRRRLLPQRLRAVPGQEDRHRRPARQVPAQRRQGRRHLRQGQVDQRDRQAHERRALPALPAGRLPGRRRGVHNNAQQLLARPLDGRPLRQPAGDHRQRRHRLPVEAVRQPVRRRPRHRLQAVPARRRLPAHRQPLRLADLRALRRRPARTATPPSRPTSSTAWRRARTTRTS